MSIFEIIMLACFGVAWPFSIVRSYKSRSTKGKSPLFLFIIIIGYISGILHKLIFNPDFVVILYILNLLMVSADIATYFRNRVIEKKQIP